MPEAYVVRVITEFMVMDQPATELWVAVTETPQDALEAVRVQASPRSEVELLDAKLRAETVERLGLQAGQARQI